MPSETPEVAPRWALCSDCRLENLDTCSDVQPCWYPMTIADLADDPNDQKPQVWVRPGHEDAAKYRMYRRAAKARSEAKSRPWMVQHFIDNRTHTVRESITEPPHCLTCGAKSPAWDMKITNETGPWEGVTIEMGPWDEG